MSSTTEIVASPVTQQTVMRHQAATASVDETWRMAQYIASSGLFQVKDAKEAMGLMLVCQAEGLHPAEAVRRYHIIQGRPAMRADAMLAEFQARGGKVRWGDRTNEVVSAVFSHPSGGDVPVTWTIADAKEAGLLSNPTWKKYPRQMLTARVISEGIRTCLPGVVAGVYTPEEVEDFEPSQPPTQSRREPPPRAESESAKREEKRSPRDIVEAAVTEHGKRGGWCDAAGRLVKTKMDALKAYAVGRHPDNEFAQANSMAKILAEGWALFQDRMEAEQQMAEEAKRKAAKAQPAEDEPAPFDFGDDEADDHFGPAGK